MAQYIGTGSDFDVDEQPFPYLAVLADGIVRLRQTTPNLDSTGLVPATTEPRPLENFVRVRPVAEQVALEWVEEQFEYPHGPGMQRDVVVLSRLLGVYAEDARSSVRIALGRVAPGLLETFDRAVGGAGC